MREMMDREGRIDVEDEASEEPAACGPVLTTSKVLDTEWRNILEQVIPPETHPALVRTYKRFFFGGAQCLIEKLTNSDVLDESTEAATPQDINRVDAIIHEINAYFSEVAAGRQ